jgi:hypothetical protein
MKSSYRIVCAIIAWIVLFLRFIDMSMSREYSGIAETLIAFFGFFTVLTNILVAIAFTAPLLKPSRKLSDFFMRPAVRAAIASYILIVAVVYHVLIVNLFDPKGFTLITTTALNYVMPILYIADWLFFAKKRPVSYKHLPYWAIYPAVYGVLTIIRGSLTAIYPYQFLNVTDLGIGNVILNMVGFVTVFAVVGAIFIAVAHLISDRTET